MRVQIVGSTPLRFADGSPVRAASGIAPYGAGWLVVQDDATHACVWRDGTGTPLRLVPAGARATTTSRRPAAPRRSSPTSRRSWRCPTAASLALGSGSTPARMRCGAALGGAPVRRGRRPDAALRPGGRGARRNAGPAEPRGRLRAWATTLRWFQRGLPSAGAPTASVDLDLDALLGAVAGGAPAAVRVTGCAATTSGRGRRRPRRHRRGGAGRRPGPGQRGGRGQPVDLRRRPGGRLGARAAGR